MSTKPARGDESTTALIPLAGSALAELGTVAEQARDYARQSKAPNTIRAYRADWADFTAWCADRQLGALPAAPATVALYLTHLAGQGRKASTLQRRLSAISQAHQHVGLASPTTDVTVRSVWAGIRRAHGTMQQGKAPALVELVRQMVAGLPAGAVGARDRALLLVGFAGAFRRSELVSLDVADVAFTRAGLVVTLRRSKTDQTGQGRKLGIPTGAHAATCPVKALRVWLKAAGIGEGALFRPINRHGQVGADRLSDKAVALVVKKHAERVGLDPATFAGHSLRAGFATSAAAAGVEERKIAEQTGHKSMTVLRRYIREGELFKRNAAAAVGL